jgi:hypothetical protein
MGLTGSVKTVWYSPEMVANREKTNGFRKGKNIMSLKKVDSRGNGDVRHKFIFVFP